MHKTDELIEKANQFIMPTYSRFPIAFSHGKGCILTDVEGKEYLDFVGGIAVNALGYGDPGLTKVISEQAEKMLHISNLYWTEPQICIAEKLSILSGLDQVFFCNSGAEANEGAMKLARIYAKNEKNRDSVQIIAMTHSFHGRTYAAITATGQPKYQKDLDPLMPEIIHVPFNDFEALKRAVSDKTCAIIMEPIQGEGGIHPAEKDYLTQIRQLCNEENIVLIFDEVQSGIGRTGHFFAYQHYDLKPDIVSFAKGIAGGVPMGGICACKRVSKYFVPGTHASTFGGNPLASAAAGYVLSKVGDDQFLDEVQSKGLYLRERLLKLKDLHPCILDVRGFGLMQGIELDHPVSSVIASAIEKGLLLVGAGLNVIRFVPPLIISKKEIDLMIEILDSCL